MYFTEGEDIEYERIMQEIPGHNRRNIRTAKERDCPCCLYYNKRKKKCRFSYCIVFEEE